MTSIMKNMITREERQSLTRSAPLARSNNKVRFLNKLVDEIDKPANANASFDELDNDEYYYDNEVNKILENDLANLENQNLLQPFTDTTNGGYGDEFEEERNELREAIKNLREKLSHIDQRENKRIKRRNVPSHYFVPSHLDEAHTRMRTKSITREQRPIRSQSMSIDKWVQSHKRRGSSLNEETDGESILNELQQRIRSGKASLSSLRRIHSSTSTNSTTSAPVSRSQSMMSSTRLSNPKPRARILTAELINRREELRILEKKLTDYKLKSRLSPTPAKKNLTSPITIQQQQLASQASFDQHPVYNKSILAGTPLGGENTISYSMLPKPRYTSSANSYYRTSSLGVAPNSNNSRSSSSISAHNHELANIEMPPQFGGGGFELSMSRRELIDKNVLDKMQDKLKNELQQQLKTIRKIQTQNEFKWKISSTKICH